MPVGRRGPTILLALASCGAPEPRAPAAPPRVVLAGCRAAPLPPRIPPLGGDRDDVGDALGAFGGLIGTSADKRPPVVALGPALEVPRLGGAALRALVRTRVRAMRDCYLEGARVHGSVIASFAIAPDGGVRGLHVRGDVPAQVACAERALAGLRVAGPGVAIPADARASFPITFDPDPDGPSSLIEGDEAAPPWTPFAMLDDPDDVASSERAAPAAEPGVRARAAELTACFPAAAHPGSLRVVFQVLAGGAATEVRAGGYGDAAVERCVHDVLADLVLAAAPGAFGEVACDLAFGEARAWRVAPDGYARIDVARDGVRVDGELVERHAEDPPSLGAGETFLIVATPDAPADWLEHALALARDGRGTLLALAGDAREGLALVGAGRNAATITTGFEKPIHAAIVVGGRDVVGCAGTTSRTARLEDRAAVDGVAAALATRCRRGDCAESLAVALQPEARADHIAAVVDGARRAGFVRIAIGGYATCP